MQKPSLVAGEIYHVFNRGVEKRFIFQTPKEYARFVNSLETFNTSNAANNTTYLLNKEINEVRPRYEKELVEILAFALMSNHFHLLLRQIEEGGISKFMQKVCTGYTMYFNKKNERVGPLFQGKFKAVLIERDAQFMYIPHYIHKNPIDALARGEKLEDYPWSSYRDYVLGTNMYPFVNKSFFLDFFGGPREYRKDFEGFEWLQKEIED